MSKLRQSARGENCTLMIPTVCNFNPETTVLAHIGSEDKGMGIKSADWWGCYACSDCHDYIDGRRKGGDVAMRAIYILTGLYRTQKRMIAKGLIKIV